MSERLAFSRLPPSNRMRVARTPASSASSRLRAADFGDRKPAKRKRSAGRPETVRAARAAEGPGTAKTGSPRAMASRTRGKPGSETRGVPASEARATRPPCSSRARARGAVRPPACSS